MTFIVHPAWLETPDDIDFWRGVAADGARILVVSDVRQSGIELVAWLERRAAAEG